MLGCPPVYQLFSLSKLWTVYTALDHTYYICYLVFSCLDFRLDEPLPQFVWGFEEDRCVSFPFELLQHTRYVRNDKDQGSAGSGLCLVKGPLSELSPETRNPVKCFTDISYIIVEKMFSHPFLLIYGRLKKVHNALSLRLVYPCLVAVDNGHFYT